MQNKQGWNILIWFATLVTMAEGLSQVGFLTWFAKGSAAALAGVPMVPMMIALIALFFFVHYLFASTSAHTAAVLPVFLAAIVTVSGLPVKPVALILIYSIALQGVLTPYATGPAPIWYSTGYISTKDFWRLGFIFGVFYLGILLLVGLPYTTPTSCDSMARVGTWSMARREITATPRQPQKSYRCREPRAGTRKTGFLHVQQLRRTLRTKPR